ncbi:MAG TPA: ATP synthase F1 subunit delta [Acidobacteriaceae bacterium]|nr:ATP synthase F1 subunit delta [Acidobacteriaceae bacterium]
MAAVDLRYARALEAVALEKQLPHEEIRRQLQDFAGVYAESASLREVLGDPSIPQEQKVRVLDAIAERTGMNPTVRNFLAVVTGQERLHQLSGILDAYLQLADKDGGVAEAEVTSARPLDEAGRRTLEAGIARLTGGAKVRATYREDPSLIGGAVVKVGSTVYDGSVRGQLEQMKQRLVSAAV